MKAQLYAPVSIALSSTTPSAAADPQQFPDLSGYTGAKDKDHRARHTA